MDRASEAGIPAPPRVVSTVPRAIHQELIDWARDGYPNEACGILSADRTQAAGGKPDRFHRMTNAAASPSRYLMDSGEQLRVLLELDDADRVVWGIFHSHVRTPAEPSPTDVRLAAFPDGQPTFPGALYLICSLADIDAPLVRAWSIHDRQVVEVPLELSD